MTLLYGLNTVEIEVNTRCNRRCGYCPVSILPSPSTQLFMEDAVFDRLLNELKLIEFDGRLSYHFYNEPLIRRDLEKLVNMVKISLPLVWQVLFTNGDLLTNDRYSSLRSAGIDLFQITSHSMKQPPDRPGQVVYYPKDLTLTNRGGTMTNLPGPDQTTLKLCCYAPSEMLIVSFDGNVLLCYEDAERQNVMGNIMNNSIEEIWNSKKFIQIRKSLAKGNRREASEICLSCSNAAHQDPGSSYVPAP